MSEINDRDAVIAIELLSKSIELTKMVSRLIMPSLIELRADDCNDKVSDTLAEAADGERYERNYKNHLTNGTKMSFNPTVTLHGFEPGDKGAILSELAGLCHNFYLYLASELNKQP